jgi:hypothetical protein
LTWISTAGARPGRKRTALDWAAHLVEQNGRELADSFLSAARNGDWRAAEALMNRIYGKPELALVAHVPENPAAEGLWELPSIAGSSTGSPCRRLRRSSSFSASESVRITSTLGNELEP